MSPSEAEHTIIGSYRIVKTITGSTTTSAPTAFPFGVVTGDMNLLDKIHGGVADETRAYRVELLITGVVAGSATIEINGVAGGGGCEEPICKLVCTIGAVVETGTYRFADTIVLTNYHLAEDNILRVDSGNSHPCKVGFDAIGYQWLRFYVSALTNTTDIRIYARIL